MDGDGFMELGHGKEGTNLMWEYQKRLQFPVNIKKPDAKLAKLIITQLGGADGEVSAALRYLNQRYVMPYPEVVALLTDIGTEELNHVEIISAVVRQLTRNLSMQEIKDSGFDSYYVDHTLGIYPVSAAGESYMGSYFQSKGDPITDLHENMAAEQKARTTYENLLRCVKDDDVKKVLEFLRAREIVHYHRFGEALEFVRCDLDCKNYYHHNPAFDKNGK